MFTYTMVHIQIRMFKKVGSVLLKKALVHLNYCYMMLAMWLHNTKKTHFHLSMTDYFYYKQQGIFYIGHSHGIVYTTFFLVSHDNTVGLILDQQCNRSVVFTTR